MPEVAWYKKTEGRSVWPDHPKWSHLCLVSWREAAATVMGKLLLVAFCLVALAASMSSLTKEEEESNSTPELQSSQSDPLAGNLVEPDNNDGSGFEETPDIEDEHEQENEESIRSEQAVPFHTDLKSSGFDVKKSKLGKRFDLVDDEEKEDGPIIEPSFTSSISSSSSIAVSLSPLELEVGNFPF